MANIDRFVMGSECCMGYLLSPWLLVHVDVVAVDFIDDWVAVDTIDTWVVIVLAYLAIIDV